MRAETNTRAGTPAPPIQSQAGTAQATDSAFLPFGIEPGVIFVSAEDAVEDVLLPRLAAAGANVERCAFVEGVSTKLGLTPDDMPKPHELRRLQLPDHIGVLAEEALLPGAFPLLILDPVTSFMAPGVSVGRVFGALTRLAQVYDLAVLAVCHLSKARASRALYRVRGSLEYVSVARSVLLLSVDQTDPGRRVLHHLKSADFASDVVSGAADAGGEVGEGGGGRGSGVAEAQGRCENVKR